MRWIVDGMNVIGTRPDGWWRDRHAAMTRLVDRLERWVAVSGADVTVVFEKPPSPPIRSTVISITHAPKPRQDSADDEIIRLLRCRRGAGDGAGRDLRPVARRPRLRRRRERRARRGLPGPDRRRRVMPPETRYADSDGASIAYQVAGEGNIDVLFLPGWISQIEQLWEAPANRHFLERLGAFSRLILFDSRGTGLSERSPAHLHARAGDPRRAGGARRRRQRTGGPVHVCPGRAGGRQAGGGAPPEGRCPGDVRLGRADVVGPGLRLGDDGRAARTGRGPRHLHLGGTGQSAAGAAGSVDGR